MVDPVLPTSTQTIVNPTITESNVGSTQTEGKVSENKPVTGSSVKEPVSIDDYDVIVLDDISLQGAETTKLQSSEDVVKTLQKNMTPHKDSFWSWLGRGIMHVFQALFGRSNPSVSDVENRLQVSTRSVTTEFKSVTTDPVGFNQDLVGAAMGLKGKIALSPFTMKDVFPNGTPSIQDIKQNPSLQDCWFLSSISSVLTSQGPNAILRLFTFNEDGNTCNIRLGEKTYTVPMADITDSSGHKAISDSAPWVRMLETAMQMRLVDLAIDKTDKYEISLANRPVTEGLTALMDMGRITTKTPEDSLQDMRAAVMRAIKNGSPIVLGHIARGNPLYALVDGISPKHAVSVLDYDSKSRQVTLLDPYGRIRVLDDDVLKRCHMYIYETPEQKQAPNMNRQTQSTEERVSNPTNTKVRQRTGKSEQLTQMSSIQEALVTIPKEDILAMLAQNGVNGDNAELIYQQIVSEFTDRTVIGRYFPQGTNLAANEAASLFILLRSNDIAAELGLVGNSSGQVPLDQENMEFMLFDQTTQSSQKTTGQSGMGSLVSQIQEKLVMTGKDSILRTMSKFGIAKENQDLIYEQLASEFTNSALIGNYVGSGTNLSVEKATSGFIEKRIQEIATSLGLLGNVPTTDHKKGVGQTGDDSRSQGNENEIRQSGNAPLENRVFVEDLTNPREISDAALQVLDRLLPQSLKNFSDQFRTDVLKTFCGPSMNRNNIRINLHKTTHDGRLAEIADLVDTRINEVRIDLTAKDLMSRSDNELLSRIENYFQGRDHRNVDSGEILSRIRSSLTKEGFLRSYVNSIQRDADFQESTNLVLDFIIGDFVEEIESWPLRVHQPLNESPTVLRLNDMRSTKQIKESSVCHQGTNTCFAMSIVNAMTMTAAGRDRLQRFINKNQNVQPFREFSSLEIAIVNRYKARGLDQGFYLGRQGYSDIVAELMGLDVMPNQMGLTRNSRPEEFRDMWAYVGKFLNESNDDNERYVVLHQGSAGFGHYLSIVGTYDDGDGKFGFVVRDSMGTSAQTAQYRLPMSSVFGPYGKATIYPYSGLNGVDK